MWWNQCIFFSLIVLYTMASNLVANVHGRRHTSSDGTVREYIVSEKRWVVVEVQSENNKRSDEMLFLPSRQFNINFSAAGFTISGLPIPLVATGNLRSLEEQKDGDTGLTVWDGSILLAKALESIFGSLRNKTVLELGSGVGLVGISAAALGAKVVMTDLEYTKEQIEANIKRAENVWGPGKGGEMHFRKLDWINDVKLYDMPNVQQESFLQFKSFDLIVGADIVWLEPLILPLVRLLDVITIANDKCKVLISYQSRSKRADDILFINLKKIFKISYLGKEKWPVGFETEKIVIFVLERL